MLRHPRRFRFRDCLNHMYATGAAALPIIGVVSFLVGMIVGFQSAIQLRQFGGDIFMVSLVGLSVVREMGPMMAAVVLTGRTGAAFAAHLGNMVLGEEVDALRTLGISPIDFLVAPRLVALVAMMPLLALYADLLGILGGLSVAIFSLDLQAPTFWQEIRRVVGLSDLNVGLMKSVVFAFLIGLSGCQRGLASDRTSSGVGAAATSAVVAGILLIVLADALFGKVFETLGL
jgi:phospholipid/cholesterol/gamma-HCH transport system permease protein